jgi:hypothetical protein
VVAANSIMQPGPASTTTWEQPNPQQQTTKPDAAWKCPNWNEKQNGWKGVGGPTATRQQAQGWSSWIQQKQLQKKNPTTTTTTTPTRTMKPNAAWHGLKCCQKLECGCKEKMDWGNLNNNDKAVALA